MDVWEEEGRRERGIQRLAHALCHAVLPKAVRPACCPHVSSTLHHAVLCRPCPIGLSVAQVVGVEGRTLVLGGVDIVDGSPVLDIKPYLPFCDSVPQAGAPACTSHPAHALH